jgi:RNA-dependent RNA polymerase
MGMCFSLSEPTIQLTTNQVEVVPDLISSNGRYCFSDGCGQISRVAAEQVAKIMGLSYVPSVYQIRYQGVKGVVSVNSDMPENILLRIRPSMIKFQAPQQNILEVLNVSGPERGCLERQLCLILNHLGISSDNLRNIQYETIQELLGSMEKPISNRFLLERNSLLYEIIHDALKNNWFKKEQDILSDAFLSRMIGAACYGHLRLIEKKSVIPVKKARNAIGVVDETGTLQPGQIFFQYSSSFDLRQASSNTIILQQKVAVGKIPSLHPGDVRCLQCVDVPQLHHLVDCVVFPQTGERPIPDQIAMGSDLDGDMYYVYWDDRLVPDHDIPAGDYGSFKAEVLSESNEEFDQERMISEMKEAVTTFQNVDNTGAIFNAHMSFADTEGLDSEKCHLLIKAFKEAVGAAKHGTVYDEPFPTPESFAHYQFVKPTRHSEHALGKLYDDAEKNCDALFKPKNAPIELNLFDGEFVPNETIQARVQATFQEYCDAVREFASTVDFHGFLDLYNPHSYMMRIIGDYIKIFENQCEEFALSKHDLVQYWYECAYSAAKQAEKPKKSVGNAAREMFDESLALMLSFPWVILASIPQ